MNQKSKKGNGFTIVELMVSTVVFSLILVGASAGLVQLGRFFYKGVATVQTQEANRAIINEISQSIQFSKKVITPPPPLPVTRPEINLGQPDTFFFCVGAIRYSYAVDRKMSVNPDTANKKEKRHVFWVDEPDEGCLDMASPGPADLNEENPCAIDTVCKFGRELMPESTRITDFSIVNFNDVYTITLSLAYGDDSDSDGAITTFNGRRVCEDKSFGSNNVYFCAISSLSSSAARRL